MKSKGSGIQTIAAVFEGLGIVISIFAGGFASKELGFIFFILIAGAGILVSVVVGTFLSGFGELVESTFEIKMNVYYMRKSQIESKPPQPNVTNPQQQQPMYFNNANPGQTNGTQQF